MLCKSRMTQFVFAIGIAAAPATDTALAQSFVIDFNGLPGAEGSVFDGYKENGFKVSPVSGPWVAGQNYGHPAPFIYFNAAAGATVKASIAVKHGGSRFSFTSVDLYSSTTTIPYAFTGSFKGKTVFTVSGTIPNTFGDFATAHNPNSADVIDRLEVTLTNPAAPCCANPVGLDNIAVVAVSGGNGGDDENGRCRSVKAHEVNEIVTQNCSSPAGLCAAGAVTGDELISGTQFINVLGLAPSLGLPGIEPATTDSVAAERTITTSQGTLTFRVAGVFDTARGEIAEVSRVTGGTGIFAGATGTLWTRGTSTGTSFNGQLTGRICIAEE